MLGHTPSTYFQAGRRWWWPGAGTSNDGIGFAGYIGGYPPTMEQKLLTVLLGQTNQQCQHL